MKKFWRKSGQPAPRGIAPPELRMVKLPTPEAMHQQICNDFAKILSGATESVKDAEGRHDIIDICDDMLEGLETLDSVQRAAWKEASISQISGIRQQNEVQLTKSQIEGFIKVYMKDYIFRLSLQTSTDLRHEFLMNSIQLLFANLPLLGIDSSNMKEAMDNFISLLSEAWHVLDKKQRIELKKMFYDPQVQALFHDIEYYLQRGLRGADQRAHLMRLGREQVNLKNALSLCKEVSKISIRIRGALELADDSSARPAITEPSKFFGENRIIINSAMKMLLDEIRRVSEVNQTHGTEKAVASVFRPR